MSSVVFDLVKAFEGAENECRTVVSAVERFDEVAASMHVATTIDHVLTLHLSCEECVSIRNCDSGPEREDVCWSPFSRPLTFGFLRRSVEVSRDIRSVCIGSDRRPQRAQSFSVGMVAIENFQSRAVDVHNL